MPKAVSILPPVNELTRLRRWLVRFTLPLSGIAFATLWGEYCSHPSQWCNGLRHLPQHWLPELPREMAETLYEWWSPHQWLSSVIAKGATLLALGVTTLSLTLHWLKKEFKTNPKIPNLLKQWVRDNQKTEKIRLNAVLLNTIEPSASFESRSLANAAWAHFPGKVAKLFKQYKALPIVLSNEYEKDAKALWACWQQAATHSQRQRHPQQAEVYSFQIRPVLHRYFDSVKELQQLHYELPEAFIAALENCKQSPIRSVPHSS